MCNRLSRKLLLTYHFFFKSHNSRLNFNFRQISILYKFWLGPLSTKLDFALRSVVAFWSKYTPYLYFLLRRSKGKNAVFVPFCSTHIDLLPAFCSKTILIQSRGESENFVVICLLHILTSFAAIVFFTCRILLTETLMIDKRHDADTNTNGLTWYKYNQYHLIQIQIEIVSPGMASRHQEKISVAAEQECSCNQDNHWSFVILLLKRWSSTQHGIKKLKSRHLCCCFCDADYIDQLQSS